MNVSQGTSGQPEHGRIMEEEGKQNVTNGGEKGVRREEMPKASSSTEEKWAARAYKVIHVCLENMEMSPQQLTEADGQNTGFRKLTTLKSTLQFLQKKKATLKLRKENFCYQRKVFLWKW